MHLKEFASNCIKKKETFVFNLKCACGNETFKIIRGKTNESKQAEEKWNNYWKKYRFVPIFEFGDAIDRKSGKRYTYGSTFFGIRIGKLYDEDTPFVKDLCIVKAICPSCKREIVLFDNRKHGYDALATIFDEKELGKVSIIPFADERGIKFRNVCGEKECVITIAIQNNLTFEDFYDTFGSNAPDDSYSNAFSWIKIIAIIDEKKRTILDMETT